VTERFTRAVDQLASKDESVRLGGIYALEQLALDSPREHGQIVEILAAYARSRARRRPVAVDVQAIVSVLARRRHERELRIDLGSTVLTEVRAEAIVLRRARLTDADLTDALLTRADLREANLVGAQLRGATLLSADLRGAKLCGASLDGANLRDAKLDGAQLEDASYDPLTVWPDGFDAPPSAPLSPRGPARTRPRPAGEA
jgi:hypothetical protein